jgi:hypothetical protein
MGCFATRAVRENHDRHLERGDIRGGSFMQKQQFRSCDQRRFRLEDEDAVQI